MSSFHINLFIFYSLEQATKRVSMQTTK